MSSPIEQIKSRLNVVDVIQSYVKLQKAGSNFKTTCPFHNEKTPSFFVSPAREVWHCFGCGAGGDLIEFIKKIEGVEFPEALRMLADRAGIELKKEDPRLRSERTRLFNLLKSAVDFYGNELQKNDAALNYLKERGLKAETISDFSLGYAPDAWDALFSHLKNNGYLAEEMEKAGLILQSSASDFKLQKYYDRFRNRIMFPLADAGGRVVGFSGRFLEIGKSAINDWSKIGGKYINTPQTVLYDKSRVLYCFDRAKTEIRKQNTCILVEGQMDAIMSHQAGVKNAVAISGTALTGYQLTMIKRLADRLIIAFDMDPAGGMATKRGIDLALGQELEVKVAVISGGKDPADLVKENPAFWKKSLENSRHIIEFYLDMLSLKYRDDLYALRKKTAQFVLPYIAVLENEMDKAHWVALTAKNLQMKEEPIWNEVRKQKNSAESGFANSAKSDFKEKTNTRNRKRLLEERIIGLAVWKKEEVLAKILKERGHELFSDELKPFVKFAAKETTEFPNEHQSYLNRLALETELLYGDKDIDYSGEIKDLFLNLECEHTKNLRASLAIDIQKAEKNGDQKDLQRLIGEFNELSKKLI